LVLGLLRELSIAQQLRASGDADLFFRGLVVVGAARNFTLALLRARWIPLPAGPSPLALLRAGLPSCTLIVAVSIASFGFVIPREQWLTPEIGTFALCVVVGSYGAAFRALSERHGHERLGVALDWAPLLGTIAGVLLADRVVLGAIGGLTCGLAVAMIVQVPTGLREHGTPATSARVLASPGWALYVDTLIYVNLGLLDSVLSLYVLDEGEFALLSYGYLFVNAVLAVPTAGATIVVLRIGGRGRAEDAARLRGWALAAGGIAALGVAFVGAALAWPVTAGLLDRAVHWSMSERIAPLVLCSAPFAGLRLANTIGRQLRVAGDPDGLVVWDVIGLVVRAAVLGFGAAWIGPVASPIALALAEAIQLGAWSRWRHAG
jgi:hypothetical protein